LRGRAYYSHDGYLEEEIGEWMLISYWKKEGKQDIILEYVVTCEVGKEVVWLRNMLSRFV